MAEVFIGEGKGKTVTLEEFYTQVGGSYEEVLGRLRKDSLITKYLGLFGSDQSFADLAKAVPAQDWQGVFAASHTLKGLAANLGLENLRAAASDICENCRNKQPDENVQAQFERVEQEYQQALSAIDTLKESLA